MEDNNVSIGTATPTQPPHVRSTTGAAKVLVEETAGGSFEELMELFNQDDLLRAEIEAQASTIEALESQLSGVQP